MQLRGGGGPQERSPDLRSKVVRTEENTVSAPIPVGEAGTQIVIKLGCSLKNYKVFARM